MTTLQEPFSAWQSGPCARRARQNPTRSDPLHGSFKGSVDRWGRNADPVPYIKIFDTDCGPLRFNGLFVP